MIVLPFFASVGDMMLRKTWILLFVSLCVTACNSAFLKGVKELGAEASCAAIRTSAITLAKDIAANDVRSYPFWRNGKPIPLQEQRDFCVGQIQAEKFMILEKPWKGKDHFTTTIPLPRLSKIPGWENIPGVGALPEDTAGLVLTENGLDFEPLLNQVATYCHELVHVYTEKRLGLLTSGVAYTIPPTRAGFEFPSYGVTVAIHYLNGVPLKQIEGKALGIVSMLHENYLLRVIPKACLQDVAVGYWQTAKWLNPDVIRSDAAIQGTYE